MRPAWDRFDQPSPHPMDTSTLSSVSLAWNDAERAALVALLRERPGGRSWPELVVKVADCGSAVSVWESLSPAEQPLFGEDQDRDAILRGAREDVDRWHAADFGFLTFMDEQYPAHLRDVHQVPPVLFTRGTLPVDEIGVSVVGSRKASPRGLAFAREISTALSGSGISVISGLAAGIDTAAHLAALEASGRTVAVIGTGIERCYPQGNQLLQSQIATHGLVMSQ